MRRLVVGDLHGTLDKLMQALENCKFSDDDELYSLGDFCDRGHQNYDTLNFIMSLGDRFKPIIGNHDWWLYLWLYHTINNPNYNIDERDSLECWINYNGGKNTFKELKDIDKDWLKKVYEWMKTIPFMRKIDNKILIHSIAPKEEYEWRKTSIPLEEINLANIKESGLMTDIVYDSYLWSRKVIPVCNDFLQIGYKKATDHSWEREKFEQEFTGDPVYIVGHTPLDHPFYDKKLGIAGIDTGAFCTQKEWGIEGSLTILDIDTFEYWQSGKKESKILGEY